MTPRGWKAVAAAAGVVGLIAAGVALRGGAKRPVEKVPPPAPAANAAKAPPGPAPAVAPPATGVGSVAKWEVLYRDAALGEVTGTALVDWQKGFASVEVRDPRTGERHCWTDPRTADKECFLTSRNVTLITAGNPRVTMTLDGESPSAEETKPPKTPEVRLASAKGDPANVAPGEPALAVDVENAADADFNRARLFFRVNDVGALLGVWRYLANPLTERDAKGRGRVGHFRMVTQNQIARFNSNLGRGDKEISGGFLGMQSGSEEWWPLPMSIATVVVVEDQLAFKDGKPVYGYPFETDRRAPAASPARRTLCVVGRDFPMQDEKWFGAQPPSPYRLKAVSTDPHLPKEVKDQFWAARLKLLDQLPDPWKPESRQSVLSLDAVLLEMDLTKDDLPGQKTFQLGSETASWWLQYGDNLAETLLVRSVHPQASKDSEAAAAVEPASPVYLPENVRVEVRTKIPVPLDRVPLMVGGAEDPNRWTPVIAQRVSPTLFRTDFIPVVPSAGTVPASQNPTILPFVAKPGDRISVVINERALLDEQKFQFRETQYSETLVAGVPELTRLTWRREKIAKRYNAPEGSWGEALALAYSVDQSKVPSRLENGKWLVDWDAVSREPIAKVGGVPITVGAHAAMLLLRDQFLELMREQRDSLQAVKDEDDALEAFRQWLAPCVFYRREQLVEPAWAKGEVKYPSWLSFAVGDQKLDVIVGWVDGVNQSKQWLIKSIAESVKKKLRSFEPGNAFGNIPVSGPTGREWPFYETFDRFERYEAFFGREPEGYEKWRAWRRKTAREALDYYQKTVVEAVEAAEEIQPADHEALLKLTGVEFGHVTEFLLPRLMRREAGGDWSPDRIARYTVLRIGTLAAAALAGKELTSVKWQLAMTVPEGIAMASGLGFVAYEGAAAGVVSMYSKLSMWYGLGRGALVDGVIARAEVRFELASAPLLGMQRLSDAERRQPDWVDNLVAHAADMAAQHFLRSVVGPHSLEAFREAEAGRQILVAWKTAGGRPRLGEIKIQPRVSRAKKGVSLFLGLTPEQQAYVLEFLARVRQRLDRLFPLSRRDLEAYSIAESDAVELPPKALPVVERPPRPLPVVDYVPPEKRVPPAPIEPVPRPVERGGEPPEGPSASGVARSEQETRGKTSKYDGLDAVWERLKMRAPGSIFLPGAVEAGRPLKYKLGEFRSGRGASSFTYELTKEHDGARFPGRNLIKILRSSEHFGSPSHQAARMTAALDELEEMAKGPHPIGFAQIREIRDKVESPYAIQEEIVPDRSQILMIDPADFQTDEWGSPGQIDLSALRSVFTRDLQVAMARLHLKFGLNRRACPDLSLTNVYFVRSGGKAEAKILDIDHIVAWDAVIGEGRPEIQDTLTMVRAVLAHPRMLGVRSPGEIDTDPVTFMRAMMEVGTGGNFKQPYLIYDWRGRLQPGGLINDPTVIEEVFGDLGRRSAPRAALPSEPGPPAPPAAPPERAPVPEKRKPDGKGSSLWPLPFSTVFPDGTRFYSAWARAA